MQGNDSRGADDGAEDGAQAAKQGHQNHLPRRMPMDVAERGELEDQGLGCPGRAGQRRGNDEGDQLELVDVVAERDGARLILADSLEDLAERRVDGAVDDKEAGAEDGEYQVIHIQSWWNTVAVLTALICKIKSWKYIISPRGMLSPYTIEHSIVKKIIHNLIGNYLLKNAIIHVTSNDEKQKLDKLNPRYTLIDVPNYVDVNSKSQNVIRSENSDIFNLLFLSRIHPKKGLEDLFSALSKVGFNYHLSIVGDGDSNYIEELKLLSRKLMIENSISWKGALYNDDKIRSYANADVFILPSKDENFANTVLESLAQGTAVIVSKNVGLSDFVSDNNLGWVYDGSVNNLEEVLNESKTSPQKLKNIRETSTSIIESNFSEANISNRYIAMYNTSLNSH